MTWMIKIAVNMKLEVIAIMLNDRYHMQIRKSEYETPVRVSSENQNNVSKPI